MVKIFKYTSKKFLDMHPHSMDMGLYNSVALCLHTWLLPLMLHHVNTKKSPE